MGFGSQQTATLLTVFEYKKCDQNRKNFCHIKLEMAMLFENVVLSSLTEKGELKQNYSTPVRLEIFEEKDKFQIKVINVVDHLEKQLFKLVINFFWAYNFSSGPTTFLKL